MGWSDQAATHYRDPRWQQLFADDMGMTVLRVDLLPLPLSSRGLHVTTPVVFGPELTANVAAFDYDRSPRARIYGEVARDLVARGGPGSLRVIASVWTPPHFLKQGARISAGGLDSGGGRLPMDAQTLEQYARYMAAAVAAWEARFGVPIDALSIQNEPRFSQDYNSMVLTPAEYARALAAVATELSRVGLATRLFGPEDVGYGAPGDHGLLDQQLAFIRAVMDEPTAAAAIDAFAVHGYGGDGIDSSGHAAPGNWRYYWSAIEGYGRPSWQTESGGGSPQWDGRDLSASSGGGPLMLANVIYEGMTYGQVSLWCNWMFSHPAPLDQHTLLGADLEIDSPKYAAAKHFFRFIRPGAQRLSVDPADRDRVRVTAWHDPQLDQLTVVLVNLRVEPARVELALGSVGQGRTLRRYQTTATANFETLAELPITQSRTAVVLPARSITTLGER